MVCVEFFFLKLTEVNLLRVHEKKLIQRLVNSVALHNVFQFLFSLK